MLIGELTPKSTISPVSNRSSSLAFAKPTAIPAENRPLKAEKGVYALILYLKSDARIVIGRLGPIDFEKGWYMYFGSAHGAGGVRARTDRHRRDESGKRKHWHVDYFLPNSTISEIWFSHCDPMQEHVWATTARKMAGARCPVLRFGSNDCKSGCAAHFVYVRRRPLLVEFLALLGSSATRSPPIYTEFVEPHATDLCLGAPTSRLLSSFDLGRRYLETFRRAWYDGHTKDGEVLPALSFRKGCLGRQIVERLSDAIGCRREQLIDDAKFAHAVAAIVANCGSESLAILFSRACPQRRTSILQLSRTSDVRQRHRIELVRAGRHRSLAPQGDDIVYDTTSFAEVPSRLSRARGALAKLAAQLTTATSPDVLAECQRLAAITSRAATQLQTYLASGSGGDIPPALSKGFVWAGFKASPIRDRFVGLGRLTLRLVIKCVWDYPEMLRRRLIPTDEQRSRSEAELRAIIGSCDAIQAARFRG